MFLRALRFVMGESGVLPKAARRTLRVKVPIRVVSYHRWGPNLRHGRLRGGIQNPHPLARREKDGAPLLPVLSCLLLCGT